MKTHCQKGFTLVELMIALLLSSLVLAAIGVAFKAQQETYTAQEEVAEMQQELRAGLEILSRELRNAGYDPTKSANAGFAVAGPFGLRFTIDFTGGGATGLDPDGDDNDTNEDFRYGLRVDAATFDADGIADAGVTSFGRGVDGGNIEELTSNIHAIGFAYAVDADGDGVIDFKTIAGVDQIIWSVPNGAGGWTDLDAAPHGDANGVIDANDAIPGALGNANAGQLDEIRAVRIWILARGSRPDPDYTDGNIYKVGASVVAAPNDNFRRRLLTANVRCRNMGIEVP